MIPIARIFEPIHHSRHVACLGFIPEEPTACMRRCRCNAKCYGICLACLLLEIVGFEA